MASRSDLLESREFHRAALNSARRAYIALTEGQAQSYAIGSRNVTKFDLTKLREEIAYHQKELAAIEAELNGGKRRKAVGVIPRDW